MPLNRCDHPLNSPTLSAPPLRAVSCSRVQAHVIRLSRESELLVARAHVSLSRAQKQSVGKVLEVSQLPQRRHQGRLQSLQQQPDRAWQKVLVVVEGLSDLRAVQRSAPAQAFVLHGASKISLPSTQEKLLKLAVQAEEVIALLDPDVAGRQSRTVLDQLLPGQVLHAFIPGLHAMASNDIRQKKAGNIGVEHAMPEQIRQALLTARRSTTGRAEFDRTDLVEWGLSVDMGTPSCLSGGCVQRRAALCFALGLGNCDGKQLLKQLNNYNFSRQDVLAALDSIQLLHRL